MLPTSIIEEDALLFALLGPVKAAAVIARKVAADKDKSKNKNSHRGTTHIQEVKVPKPKTVDNTYGTACKAAMHGPPTAPGMPQQFPMGVGLPGQNPPPEAAPIAKIPTAPKLTTPSLPKPAAPSMLSLTGSPTTKVAADPLPGGIVKQLLGYKAPGLPKAWGSNLPSGHIPLPSLKLPPIQTLSVPPVVKNKFVGPAIAGAGTAGLGYYGLSQTSPDREIPAEPFTGAPHVGTSAHPKPQTPPGLTSPLVPVSGAPTSPSVAVPPAAAPVPEPELASPVSETQDPSWFQRNQDWMLPAGLAGGGLLAGGLFAAHQHKKKRYNPDGTEIDEEKEASDPFPPGYDKPISELGVAAEAKPLAMNYPPKFGPIGTRGGVGMIDQQPGMHKTHITDQYHRNQAIQEKDYKTPEGFVEKNWPYLLGGAGVAGLGYLGYRALSRDDKHKKQADAVLDAVDQGGRELGGWARANPDRANNIIGTGLTGGFMGVPAAMALRGGFSLARAPKGYALQSTARGAGIGAGAAVGSTLAGMGHAAFGEPTDLGTRLLLQGGGALAGGVGMSKLLGEHPEKKDEAKERTKAKEARYQKRAEDPSIWGNLGDLNASGAWNAAGQQANSGIDAVGKRLGQSVMAGATDGGTGGLLGKGVDDFLGKNRWANYAAWGAPIGAGIGLLGGLFNRKKKRNALGDALTGGLLGAGAGALAGGAHDLYSGDTGTHTPPAAAATPTTPTLQSPRMADNPLLNAGRGAAQTLSDSPESLLGRDQANKAVGAANTALPVLNERGLAKIQPLRDYTSALDQANKTLGASSPLGENNLVARQINPLAGAAGEKLGLPPRATPEQRASITGDLTSKFDAARSGLRSLQPSRMPDSAANPNNPVGNAVAAGAYAMTGDQIIQNDPSTSGLMSAFPRVRNQLEDRAFNDLRQTPLDAPATPETHAWVNPENPNVRRGLGTGAAIGGFRGAVRKLTGLGAPKDTVPNQANSLLGTANGTLKTPEDYYKIDPRRQLLSQTPVTGMQGAMNDPLVAHVANHVNATSPTPHSLDDIRTAIARVNKPQLNAQGQPVPYAPSALDIKVRQALVEAGKMKEPTTLKSLLGGHQHQGWGKTLKSQVMPSLTNMGLGLGGSAGGAQMGMFPPDRPLVPVGGK